jgi:TPR repeat protein
MHHRYLFFVLCVLCVCIGNGCTATAPTGPVEAAALQKMQRKAEQGDAVVQFYLGLIYKEGRGGVVPEGGRSRNCERAV